MIQIIISILLSIGVKSDGSDIKIMADKTFADGTEVVTFYDNSNGNTYTIEGTEQNGWGIVGDSADGTEQNGWGYGNKK